MMKYRKIFISMVVIFAMSVTFLPQNADAYNVGSIHESDESGSDSNAVLAYYDVKTKTETLFTEKDLQNAISKAKTRSSIETTIEPQGATEPHSIQNLTQYEIEQFEEARENTMVLCRFRNLRF